MPISNPQLSLTNAQYSVWKISAEAIAGSSYIFDPGNVTFNPYRPKQWNEKLLFYLMDSDGKYYFFDAVLKTEHVNQRRITQHPIQVGANISDHSFQLPARLTMEIGVSDVMDCYNASYDWVSEEVGRSINAFQGLKKLQDSGQSLSVTTRLFTYDNMIIESISVPEDYRTLYSLRASIIFQQIITVQTSTTKTSLIKDTTNNTALGPVSTEILTIDNPYYSSAKNILGF
jgi:hypothetical protein